LSAADSTRVQFDGLRAEPLRKTIMAFTEHQRCALI
jgi:hypothetical protein